MGANDDAIDYEVVDDGDTSVAREVIAQPSLIVPAAPVHPLSSLVTIAIDQVWGVMEVGATLSVAGMAALIPLMLTSAVSCFVAVLLIQRYLDQDTWRVASSKAVGMGILAGVPYQFVGTAAGAVLLTWAGVHAVETAVRRYLPA